MVIELPRGTGLAIAAALTISLSGCAAFSHHASGNKPAEPGQGAFGAIAEIVQILSNDPGTDWSKVDIDGLRQHLVDMNALTLNADVQTEERANEVIYRISGTGNTRRAIQEMVPAHARQMASSGTWDTNVDLTDNGATLTVQADSPQTLQKLKALGFFGFMAMGSHHQTHHLGMASGQGHHHGH